MAFEIEVQISVFRKTKFYIDEQRILFDNKEIPIKNIIGLGYMSTQTSVNGIPTSKLFEINIWESAQEKPIVLRFSGAFKGGSANDKFLNLIDELWTYFGNKLLNRLHEEIMQGKVCTMIPGVKLTSSGIVTFRKPIFRQGYELLARWNDLSVTASNGHLWVKAKSNRKARMGGSLKGKNLWVLYNYINWLGRNPDVLFDLMAVTNNYKLIEKPK